METDCTAQYESECFQLKTFPDFLTTLESIVREVIKAGGASDYYQAIVALGCERRVLELVQYSGCTDFAIKLTESPTVPSFLLERLARHHAVEVRQAVAESRRSPLTAIWLLAKDSNADVRYALAECHHMPAEILDFLSCDDNPFVAMRAMQTRERLEREHTLHVLPAVSCTAHRREKAFASA